MSQIASVTEIATSVLIDAEVLEIEAAFSRELRWSQGHRVNLDARLLLVGLNRLRERLSWKEAAFRNCALVAGSRLGAMDSYEAFDRSIELACPAPLAFASALPSIPLACASLCFSLRGPVLTLMGDVNVGVDAVRQAAALLRAGRSSHAIAGCWEAPSDTARHVYQADSRCRLLLVAMDKNGSEQPGSGLRDPMTDTGVGPVARLSRQLADLYRSGRSELVHE